jgi:hypothetical protein
LASIQCTRRRLRRATTFERSDAAIEVHAKRPQLRFHVVDPNFKIAETPVDTLEAWCNFRIETANILS